MKNIEGIEQKVIDIIDKELMEYIIEDTRSLIQTFESKILSKEYEVFSKFDKLMKRVQNVIELSFKFTNNLENTIPCDVAWLLIDLTELKNTICRCDYKFEEMDDFFKEPKVVGDLGEFISNTASGWLFLREKYFTLEDIEKYKNKLEKEKETDKQRAIRRQVEQKEYVEKQKSFVEEWLKENANKDFDFSVLSELEIDILKEGLKTELKSISISWIQRRFAMGYCKAGRIIDHLEECGAISTYEEAEALGLAKSGRIIKISL